MILLFIEYILKSITKLIKEKQFIWTFIREQITKYGQTFTEWHTSRTSMEIYGLSHCNSVLIMIKLWHGMWIMNIFTLLLNLITSMISLAQSITQTHNKWWRDICTYFGVIIYMWRIGVMIQSRALFGTNLVKLSIDYLNLIRFPSLNQYWKNYENLSSFICRLCVCK